ncbi:MaoC/PaaZ C-terminal domain-containing protein [Paenibacillus koleovorans]|uniref:MaoC/PaaZ C-terminal domain-containing protein n=1 Tax=Paenibacillus koleovorans TaxID=121608 RepID=UPI000FDCDD51|nr:MaoC/PaaZ C-terminal domain-containing protein [Paenibacillus koleovorans]
MNWTGLQVGRELDPLVKPPVDNAQLSAYAQASGDFNPIHTDDRVAREKGLDGVIAHGMLVMGFVGQYAGRIVGLNGFVSRLQVRFVEMVKPGDALVCRAEVVAKDETAWTAELELTVEKEPGRAVAVGRASLNYTREMTGKD